MVRPDEIRRGDNTVETGQGDGSDCTALLCHTEHMSVSNVFPSVCGFRGERVMLRFRPQVLCHSKTYR